MAKKTKTSPLSPWLAVAVASQRTWLLQQAEGRQRLQSKVPSWAAIEDLHYPVRLSLEQCSSEMAAAYKAEVAAHLCPDGGSMADLTGGFGVDFCFLAKGFQQACYIERNEALCAIARHNFPLLGLAQAQVFHTDALSYLEAMTERVDFLLLDPARRDTVGRKMVSLSDCEPDVAVLHDVLRQKSRWTMVKLSPMLDITAALRSLPAVVEVHLVAVGGECKELLLVLGDGVAAPVVHCVDEHHRFSFTYEEEAAAVAPTANEVGAFLFEPSPAVMKAGAFRTLAARYSLYKLHPNTHLYTAAHDCPDFPGRRFRVLQSSGFSKKEVRPLAGTKANLAVRNFPDTVVSLRRRLRLAEGGEKYLFATTVGQRGDRQLLWCEKA